MKPEPLLKTAWIKKGAFVVPYGTMSAVELSLTDIMSKMVVDDWGQCKGGPFGSLRAHVDAGKLIEEDAACRTRPDRRRPQAGPRARRRDHPVLASRPVACRDIALGHAMLEKAARLGIGQRLRFAERSHASHRQCPHVCGHAAVAAAWRELFAVGAGSARASTCAGSTTPTPAPLGELWSRDDLGCAFMCGWPFARRSPRPRLSPHRCRRRRVTAAGRSISPISSCAPTAASARSRTRSAAGVGYTVERFAVRLQRRRATICSYPHGVAAARSTAEAVGPLVTPRRRDRGAARRPHRRRPARQLRARSAEDARAGSSPGSSASSTTTEAAPIPPLVAAPAMSTTRWSTGFAARSWRPESGPSSRSSGTLCS